MSAVFEFESVGHSRAVFRALVEHAASSDGKRLGSLVSHVGAVLDEMRRIDGRFVRVRLTYAEPPNARVSLSIDPVEEKHLVTHSESGPTPIDK